MYYIVFGWFWLWYILVLVFLLVEVFCLFFVSLHGD